MQAEQEQIRKNLRNQSEENASLQSEVSMLKKKLKEAATTVVLPQFPSLPAQIPTSTSSGNISSFEEQNPIIIRKQDDIPPETSPVDFIGSSLASFPNYDGRVNPLQVELESVVGQYQTSLRRIVLLESEMGKIAELQKENGNLKTKLQENVRNYDELLELDGERLERIEELQQDVLDLRELLRNQMLVFAEAQTRKMQTENESISIQDDEQ
ncbi:hypothetical protein WR25_08794 [Diploscapter pachys]|uniref:TATA element modulatory factor 1 TATA binding domain-containing protein n=1 Tax=Diploscapter pachys TaxID=2018661 RepID=A0A2A2JW79_9BILA|nr:hypothetical protein WR25_08794 [Diploscapter pachys]